MGPLADWTAAALCKRWQLTFFIMAKQVGALDYALASGFSLAFWIDVICSPPTPPLLAPPGPVLFVLSIPGDGAGARCRLGKDKNFEISFNL